MAAAEVPSIDNSKIHDSKASIIEGMSEDDLILQHKAEKKELQGLLPSVT